MSQTETHLVVMSRIQFLTVTIVPMGILLLIFLCFLLPSYLMDRYAILRCVVASSLSASFLLPFRVACPTAIGCCFALCLKLARVSPAHPAPVQPTLVSLLGGLRCFPVLFSAFRHRRDMSDVEDMRLARKRLRRIFWKLALFTVFLMCAIPSRLSVAPFRLSVAVPAAFLCLDLACACSCGVLACDGVVRFVPAFETLSQAWSPLACASCVLKRSLLTSCSICQVPGCVVDDSEHVRVQRGRRS